MPGREKYRCISLVTGRGETERHRIDLVVTAAAVNGIVEQHIAVRLQRDAPDQTVERAAIEVEGTLAWSFAEPELVVELQQFVALVACPADPGVGDRITIVDAGLPSASRIAPGWL